MTINLSLTTNKVEVTTVEIIKNFSYLIYFTIFHDYFGIFFIINLFDIFKNFLNEPSFLRIFRFRI